MLDRNYRLILDEIPDGVLVESRDRIAYVNDAYAKLLGYRNASELSAGSIEDIAYLEDLERLSFYGRRRVEGKPAPLRYEFRVRRADQSVISLDATVSVTRLGGDALIITVARTVLHGREVPSFDFDGYQSLSGRERQIFKMLLAGRRAKEIAFDLNISEKTVATHRSRMYSKLAFRSDLDMFRFAAERGLLGGGAAGTQRAQ